jgi:hypothetical protein
MIWRKRVSKAVPMIWKRKVSKAATKVKEHRVVDSPDNADKTNRAANPDKTSRKRVDRVRVKLTRTTRNAIVNVALLSINSLL